MPTSPVACYPCGARAAAARSDLVTNAGVSARQGLRPGTTGAARKVG